MNNKTFNILVIDDSSTSRIMIKQVLQKGNYNITEAENGFEGIETYSSGNFHLVITDIYMPISNGLEVVMHIKREYADAKIIVLSDGGDDNFKNELDICESLGATYFLSKAHIKDKLFPLVETVLGN